MKKKEIEDAVANDRPLYWNEVTSEKNTWHRVQVVDYDAANRQWQIETPVGIRCVGSNALFPPIFGNEIFLGADDFVHACGSASVQKVPGAAGRIVGASPKRQIPPHRSARIDRLAARCPACHGSCRWRHLRQACDGD